MIIREETSKDYDEVDKLIFLAFENEEFSDHQEHLLVDSIRNSNEFVPGLSLVAEEHGQVVGYILLSKIKIIHETAVFESLALAPVAVLPSRQGKGIGGKLIQEAHKRAMELGFGSVILLGHAAYYPKFGYKQADTFGIKLPFDVPSENCMAIELTTNALQEVQGMVSYPPAFYG